MLVGKLDSLGYLVHAERVPAERVSLPSFGFDGAPHPGTYLRIRCGWLTEWMSASSSH